MELELTILAEGEYHKVNVRLEPEENGRFAGDDVPREDIGGDYKVEVEK